MEKPFILVIYRAVPISTLNYIMQTLYVLMFFRSIPVHPVHVCALCVIMTTSATSQGTYQDVLGAGHLLGDHFGIPGIVGSYDYVIIGGGTAGNVLARRLAANTSITVALIEAGGFYEMDNGNLT